MSSRKWKAIKGTFVSLWVVLLAAYAIHSGAEPTMTALLAVATVALINGIEASELLAAYGELTGGSDSQPPDPDPPPSPRDRNPDHD